MSEIKPTQQSPKWGQNTKLVVGITIVGLIAALLVRFRIIIGPLILAFILTYLLYPVAERLSTTTRMPWRTAVNLIYLLVLILVVGLITVAGLAIVQQTQSLFNFIQRFVTQLPSLVADLAAQQYTLGPFTINIDEILNLETITNQVLAVVQPVLGQLGVLLRSFAGSAAVTLGWGFFTLVVSYFLLSEAGRVPDELVHIELPGYDYDLQKLSDRLRRTWNAFLRGQLIIIALITVSYTSLMMVLGVRFALSIGIMAGLLRFIPYLGQFITIIVIALVGFFQGGNYFGMDPLQYVLMVIVITMLMDQVVDSLFTPRFLGHALGVHPAAVLVATIIAANLLGIIGLVLAAPVLATITLLGRYVLRKMFDLEPFPEDESVKEVEPIEPAWRQLFRRVQNLVKGMAQISARIWKWIRARFRPTGSRDPKDSDRA